MNVSRMMASGCLVIAVAATATYGDWNWSTLDYPGGHYTKPWGISGKTIVGTYTDASGKQQSFMYNVSSGAWTTPAYPGATQTFCLGIDGNNIVGDYDDASGNCHGFLYNVSSGNWTRLDYPGAGAWTAATGMSGNTIAGQYANSNCSLQRWGFLYDGTRWTKLEYPGATMTEVWGVSGSNVVGDYDDANGIHGFLYDGTQWMKLDYPGAGLTEPSGIDGKYLVGYYYDDSDQHGFLYDGSSWTNLDYPGANATGAQAVSGGNIVGYYVDAGGSQHGFLLPIPEPPPTTPASADVLNLGGTIDPAAGTWTGLASVQFVTAGDPGNVGDTRYPDTANGVYSFGSVGYTYQIGKYAITAGQYCVFLNSVAQFSDTYRLYNTYMDANNYDLMASYGPGYYGCDIKRRGTSGSYVYSVAADWANRPVNYISWSNAARFCNWLTNGQPSGVQNASTTEDGSYCLNGVVNCATVRRPNARYVIPTEDEWYKAAYYDPTVPGGAKYWSWATQSDTYPSNVLSATGSNNANYYDELRLWGNGTYTIGAPYWRTEVGAFASSASAYGTYDQTGNVSEWTETTLSFEWRILRGGLGYLSLPFGAAGTEMSGCPVQSGDRSGNNLTGFRVAYFPEPIPYMVVSPAGFNHRLKKMQSLPNDQLGISNPGGGTLTYTMRTDASWLSVNPAGGSSSNGMSNSHDVVYDVAGLAAGSYTGTITIDGPGAFDSPQSISVTVIIDPVLIVCSPAAISRHVKQTQSLPEDQFTVASDVAYTISSSASWLSVDPPAGNSSNGAINTHTIIYSVSSLAVGTHTSSISIDSPDADNSPQTIVVTVIVDPVPGDMDGDGDVDQTDFGLLQACLSGTAVPYAEGCARADLDAHNDVDSTDVDIFYRCLSLSGPGIQGSPTCN